MRRIFSAFLVWAALTGLSMAGEMPFDPVHYEATQSPEFKGVTLFVANFDTEKVLERALGVSKQSTIVVFKDGKEAARSTGDTQYDSLREILSRAQPNAPR
jgi:hypothetical protein